MSGRAVLIAGFSGRALAQSARRAGYVPFVADACGDSDMRDAAASFRPLAHAMDRGFRARSLIAALEELSAEAGQVPVGLVLGSGFEDDPELIAELERKFELLACRADVVRRVKDPVRFFALLDQLGVAHPETRIDAPPSGAGWLSKRVGGSGGLHIARCRARVMGTAGRYFQRQVSGEPVSVSGVVSGAGTRLSITRQWTAAMPRRPYRFGGAAGPFDVPPDAAERMISAALLVARETGVAGLCSFDFLLTGEGPLLLEVNPRATATLDLLDDASGSLFAAHVNHFARPGVPVRPGEAAYEARAKALAYFYADEGKVTAGAIDWPDWTTDRPAPGTKIARWRPIATVIAAADGAGPAQELCQQRLGLLRPVVYDGKNSEEACR